MKFPIGATLGLALLIGASAPALAENHVNTGLVGGKTIAGEVTDVDGSVVTVKTADGTSQYQLDPIAASSLKLSEGTPVEIDGSRFATGRLVGLDRNTVKVKLDSGETKSFILTREERRTFVLGDRVVATGLDRAANQHRLFSADKYFLTASDIRVQRSSVVASASTVESSRVESSAATESSVIREETIAPPVGGSVEAVPPVSGLW